MSREWERAYHWFSREAVPALGLTPPQIAVYNVLRDRANERGESYPSQETIAAESGQSARAVREAVKVLARVGLVEVTPGRRQGNRYRIGMRPHLRNAERGAAIEPNAPRPERGPFPAEEEPAPAANEERRSSDSGTSFRWIEERGSYEGDPVKETQEGDPVLKPAGAGRASDDQRAFLADLSSMLGHDLPAAEDAQGADGLIREHWAEVERRRYVGEPLSGSRHDLSPRGQRYARRHGFTFGDDPSREDTA